MVSREYDELRELQERLYEQFGLASNCRKLDWAIFPFRNYRPVCPPGTVILDFSGEGKISPADAGRGSVWLDMDSVWEKRHRIEVKRGDIPCFSMKKEWEKS